MTFSLLVLGEAIPDGERIFNIAALVVLCSVVVHGLTDTPGAEWIGRRAEQRERESAAAAAAQVV
jgi:NhaP-type Na+/H+ or K+/H+ antiporter